MYKTNEIKFKRITKKAVEYTCDSEYADSFSNKDMITYEVWLSYKRKDLVVGDFVKVYRVDNYFNCEILDISNGGDTLVVWEY
jgi:hypothetical protein